MADRNACFENTTLKSIILTSSHCKLFKAAGGENVPAAIKLSTEIKLEIPDNKKKDRGFNVRLNTNIDGYPSSDNNEGKKIFELSSEMTASFSINEGFELDEKELVENPSPFTAHIYPLMRQHIVDTLGKMGVNGSATPWDIGLGKLQLIKEEEVEVAGD